MQDKVPMILDEADIRFSSMNKVQKSTPFCAMGIRAPSGSKGPMEKLFF